MKGYCEVISPQMYADTAMPCVNNNTDGAKTMGISRNERLLRGRFPADICGRASAPSSAVSQPRTFGARGVSDKIYEYMLTL
jgi:hypothetical protein